MTLEQRQELVKRIQTFGGWCYSLGRVAGTDRGDLFIDGETLTLAEVREKQLAAEHAVVALLKEIT